MREFEPRYLLLNFLPRELDDLGIERSRLRLAGRRAAVTSLAPWCAWLPIACALWGFFGIAMMAAPMPDAVARIVVVVGTAVCLLVTWPLFVCVAISIAHERIAALLEELRVEICSNCGHLAPAGAAAATCVECGGSVGPAGGAGRGGDGS